MPSMLVEIPQRILSQQRCYQAYTPSRAPSTSQLHSHRRDRSRGRLTVQAVAVPSHAEDKQNVVVVGGGWAGFGAAKHLAEQGYNVTLLDAAPNPGGLSAGWRTPQGRAVEAGVKGFWYQVTQLPAACIRTALAKSLLHALMCCTYACSGAQQLLPAAVVPQHACPCMPLHADVQ